MGSSHSFDQVECAPRRHIPLELLDKVIGRDEFLRQTSLIVVVFDKEEKHPKATTDEWPITTSSSGKYITFSKNLKI